MNDMRLGDLDALKAEFEQLGLGEHSLIERVFADGVYAVIENAPTIDAVPVVRCKDCKHYEEPYCMLCKTRIGTSYHSKDMTYRKADDFCSYGERKEADGNG